MSSRRFGTYARTALALIAGLLVFGLLPAAAQQAPPAGGAPGGRGSTARNVYSDYTGFTKLWDGESFKNWNGEMDVWSIDNGAIHADTTKTPGQHHIHYIGPGAVMKDFHLKVEMKMSATGANGGIQYRSRLLHPAHGGSIENPLGKDLPAGVDTLQKAIDAGVTAVPEANPNAPAGGAGRGAPRGGQPPAAAPPPIGGCTAIVPSDGGGAGRGGPGGAAPAAGAPAAAGAARGTGGAGAQAGGRGPQAPNPWQVSGYQFDMSSANNFTGQLYEGQGRGIVSSPGCFVVLGSNRVNTQMGTVVKEPALAVHPNMGVDGEWNQIEIIALGNTLIHMMNGQVITVTIDNNPTERAYQGILSLQLEGSGQIWYRNVYVKALN
jgi:hypothetical protein